MLATLPRLCGGRGEVPLTEVADDLGWPLSYTVTVGWSLIENRLADTDAGLGDPLDSLNCHCENSQNGH